MKIGTLDLTYISNIQIREGQRILGVEFVGIPSKCLTDRCIKVVDCYEPGYNSERLFNKGILQQQLSKHVSLCIVKPHILKSENLSKVVSNVIESGFDVSSLELVNLNKFEVDEL